MTRIRYCCILVLLAGVGSQALAFDLQSERQKMLARQRRVIFNNDGAEVFLFPADKEVTPENVLDMRTTALAGTHVDAIFYNPSSPSFGLVTHYTEVLGMRDYYEGRHQREGKLNAVWPLIEQGNDSLALMIAFARKHDMELFLSKRMNDTHDAGRHRPGKPNPTFAPLKRRHPEYLVGSHDNRPPLGRWSAVDYGRPEVRDLTYRYLEEVCRNYDTDGIELDFFRHPQLFQSVLRGEKASREELDMMTGLIERIREMTEREGERRGRPILVAVRVPDSVAYCRAMGIDLERWLAEGFVDILIGSCYFRLNHWEYLVELGHRYGAKVYPGLSESRLGGTDVAPFTRSPHQAQESYRARAAQAWASGADGIYVFNFFDAEAPMFKEIGDPEVLAGLNKTYFVTVRNRRRDPSSWVAGGSEYFNVPILSPQDPLRLAVGQTKEVELRIGDDLKKAVEKGLKPKVACHIRGDFEQGLAVSLNGTELTSGQWEDPWLKFSVSPENVRQGPNHFELTLTGGTDSAVSPWVPAEKALAFDGEGYVEATDLPELHGTTWSVWVKSTETNSYSSIMNATFDGAGVGHLLDLRGGVPRVVWNHGVERSDLRSSDSLPLGKWSHIAVSFNADAGELRLYVNGKLKDSIGPVRGSPFRGIHLGQRIVSNDYPFTGLMKDARIHNRALSNAEIEVLAGMPSPEEASIDLEAGQVAHWPLDEESGRLARDATANRHDAELFFGRVPVHDLVVTIEFAQ